MSEKVKRYIHNRYAMQGSENNYGGDTEYVEYEDYARLEKQLEEIREEAKEAQIVLEVMEAND